jgi:hypothetical protein
MNSAFMPASVVANVEPVPTWNLKEGLQLATFEAVKLGVVRTEVVPM